MTPLMDAVAEAAVDVPRLYPVNGVPRREDEHGKVLPPAYPYAVFSASLGRADGYTLDASSHLRWVRVTAQFFGKSADSVLTQTETFLTALLDKTLVVDGLVLTPLRLELDPTPPTRDPDDSGVLGVTTTLTAVATKEP